MTNFSNYKLYIADDRAAGAISEVELLRNTGDKAYFQYRFFHELDRLGECEVTCFFSETADTNIITALGTNKIGSQLRIRDFDSAALVWVGRIRKVNTDQYTRITTITAYQIFTDFYDQ